jgi:hypothetical protein
MTRQAIRLTTRIKQLLPTQPDLGKVYRPITIFNHISARIWCSEYPHSIAVWLSLTQAGYCHVEGRMLVHGLRD